MIRGSAAALTARTVREIAPAVSEEMARWRRAALSIADPFLKSQALASQVHKRFHALGGSVYALLAPGRERRLVTLIVALQTISDYLDNLGDRTGSMDERDFRALHQSLLDAVQTTEPVGDYYRYHPERDDGGYLAALVEECRARIAELPYYDRVEAEVVRQVRRYCDLQVYKHLPWPEREERLIAWHASHPDRRPDLAWWEFAAASGSTLGVFALFAEALEPLSPRRLESVAEAYFPWVCGVHILLDYFIDQHEDAVEGDLNFVSYYADAEEATLRMRDLVRRAVQAVRRLPDAGFHLTVVEGLLAMYLSDRKVAAHGLEEASSRLLDAGGVRARLLHWMCGLWRRRRSALRVSRSV